MRRLRRRRGDGLARARARAARPARTTHRAARPRGGRNSAGRPALGGGAFAELGRSAPHVVARRALHARARSAARGARHLRPAAAPGHARRADRRFAAAREAAPLGVRPRARFAVAALFAFFPGNSSTYAVDSFCVCNDLLALMAFAGAVRWDLAQRLLAAQKRRLAGPGGANLDMPRLVGYPAC